MILEHFIKCAEGKRQKGRNPRHFYSKHVSMCHKCTAPLSGGSDSQEILPVLRELELPGPRISSERWHLTEPFLRQISWKQIAYEFNSLFFQLINNKERLVCYFSLAWIIWTFFFLSRIYFLQWMLIKCCMFSYSKKSYVEGGFRTGTLKWGRIIMGYCLFQNC